MTPLLSVSTLIRESWKDFLRDWNRTFRITAWLILFPVIFFLLSLASQPLGFPLFWTDIALSIFTTILSIWVGIRLARFLLATDRGDQVEKDEARIAMTNILPILLVGILEGLAVLGGIILFVFPGIFLAIALMFSQFLALEDGAWGAQALAKSYALVKGRWWPVFWRVFATGLVFIVLIVVVTNILTGIVGLIAGTAKLTIVLATQTIANPIAYGAKRLLEAIAQAAFIPLLAIWQVKLFHALKKSR